MKIEKTSLADKLLKSLEEPATEELLSDKLLKMLGDDTKSAKEYYDEDTSGWQMIETKEVEDSDGFMTDYTWYTDNKTKHIFMFGDRSIYTPDEDYADWTIEIDERDPDASFQQAQDWFDNYHGFGSEDYTNEYEDSGAEMDVTHDPLTPVEEGAAVEDLVKGSFILTPKQKEFVRTDLFENPDEYDIEKEWVITSDKSKDPDRTESDDKAFPYVLLIDDVFIDALSPDYISKIMEVKESATEDTVKQGSHWVNKGKEGTHGKFRTKKAADAQRKAMFANGYTANEALDYTIEIEGSIYQDEDGNPYHFNTFEQARDFIEENELEGAKVTRQYGKAKGDSFAIEGVKDVLKKYNAELVPGEVDKTYRFKTRQDGTSCEKELRKYDTKYHMNSNGDIIFPSAAKESIRGQVSNDLSKSVYENFIGNKEVRHDNKKR